MNIKSNITANYIALIYVSVIGVVVTPLLYQALGAAGYGLIGFYAVLQAWFVMLDFGLSAALSRMCSRYKAGAISNAEMLDSFYGVEKIFLATGIIGAIILIMASKLIASKWLGLTGNLLQQAHLSIAFMGVAIALRWISGLYRGVLNGVERQVFVGSVNVLSSTLRFPLAYLIVIWGKLDIQGYFLLQIAASLLELIILRIRARIELPDKGMDDKSANQTSLRGLFQFSAGVFGVGITNTALLQVDKILISNKIGLEDFGKFSLMIVLVNLIGMVSGPIASALIPALSRAHADNHDFLLYKLYCRYWQLCAIIIGSIASMFIVNSSEILYFWTGDRVFAKEFSQPLIFYSIGSLMFSMASYVHYAQFATGDIRLQIRYNAGMILIYLPLIAAAIIIYGVRGASYTWAFCSMAGFLYITYVVHIKFKWPNYYLWIRRYFFNSIITMLATAIALSLIIDDTDGKILLFLQLALVTILVLAAGATTPVNIRRKIKNFRRSLQSPVGK